MRISPPGIVPVEIWDLPVGGRPLYRWRGDDALPDRIADAVERVRGLYPALAHVHLGGAAASVAIADAIASRGLPCTRDDDPFAAVLAGAALVPGAGAADIAEAGVTLARGGRTWRIRRDLSRAPLRDEVSLADRAAARRSTIAALGEALATTGARELVVAVPCAFTAAGEPLECTYCWPARDADLLAELARGAGAELAVMTAAELSVVAAAPHLPAAAVALVLTLDTSVGAAVRIPEP